MKPSYVFPGQGSQSVGMLANVNAAIVEQTFREASDALQYDLWDLTQNGPEEKLNQTEFTQPALLAAGVALWRVTRERDNAVPLLLAGHSLGEYTALVCAEALSFADGVKLVAERGRLMQQAVQEGTGAMAAVIKLADSDVVKVCEQASGVVSAANFNAPGQVVISGEKAAVESAMVLAKEAGAKLVKLLPVSVPSHCALMQPAADELAKLLTQIEVRTPSMPVINNVDVQIATHPDDIRDALVRQLYSPVRWVETIQAMAAEGITDIVECGPGKVLTACNKRIDKALVCKSIDLPLNP